MNKAKYIAVCMLLLVTTVKSIDCTPQPRPPQAYVLADNECDLAMYRRMNQSLPGEDGFLLWKITPRGWRGSQRIYDCEMEDNNGTKMKIVAIVDWPSLTVTFVGEEK